jgi:SAM-dependent methyltransferase
MRRAALITGGALAAVGAAALARSRLRDRGPATAVPAEDAPFSVYAPGGRYGFVFNGPVGWVWAKLMPYMAAEVDRAVAEMLRPQPDDELLDIGCGAGEFLADRARDVRTVVGLDASPLMLREAERRLADRIAAGTARLVLGNAAELPFSDGEFSAVTVIFAPFKPAEVLRVLRPGGRFVCADDNPRKSLSEPAYGRGRRRLTEAEQRQKAEEAGFIDITFRYEGGYLLVGGCKPTECEKGEMRT